MIANYHSHTFRCGHANGTEREYIENAIENGIKILGFSEHIPFVLRGGEDFYRLKTADTENYFNTLKKLREEYKKDIEIHIGFESEYYPDLFWSNLQKFQKYSPEYVILGQHYMDSKQDFYVMEGTRDEKILRYNNDSMIAGIKTGKFTYLAHPDIFVFDGDKKVYDKESERICLAAKEVDIPLEFNILGFRLGRSYPSERFFRVAAEVGNKIIIGLDAHSPLHIKDLSYYNKGKELLLKLGANVIDTVKLVNPFEK